LLLIKTYFKNIFPDINVISAENGKNAFQIYKNNKIDLILTDIQMPEMNGYQLSEEIRKLNMNIPIIALTASSIAEEKEKSIKVGINDFISKPITQNSFKEIIKKWIKYLDKV
jgi:CheY-like chemotaxis protein